MEKSMKSDSGKSSGGGVPIATAVEANVPETTAQQITLGTLKENIDKVLWSNYRLNTKTSRFYGGKKQDSVNEEEKLLNDTIKAFGSGAGTAESTATVEAIGSTEGGITDEEVADVEAATAIPDKDETNEKTTKIISDFKDSILARSKKIESPTSYSSFKSLSDVALARMMSSFNPDDNNYTESCFELFYSTHKKNTYSDDNLLEIFVMTEKIADKSLRKLEGKAGLISAAIEQVSESKEIWEGIKSNMQSSIMQLRAKKRESTVTNPNNIFQAVINDSIPAETTLNDLSLRDMNGETALHMAARLKKKNALASIKEILLGATDKEKASEILYAKNNEGQLALNVLTASEAHQTSQDLLKLSNKLKAPVSMEAHNKQESITFLANNIIAEIISANNVKIGEDPSGYLNDAELLVSEATSRGLINEVLKQVLENEDINAITTPKPSAEGGLKLPSGSILGVEHYLESLTKIMSMGKTVETVKIGDNVDYGKAFDQIIKARIWKKSHSERGDMKKSMGRFFGGKVAKVDTVLGKIQEGIQGNYDLEYGSGLINEIFEKNFSNSELADILLLTKGFLLTKQSYPNSIYKYLFESCKDKIMRNDRNSKEIIDKLIIILHSDIPEDQLNKIREEVGEYYSGESLKDTDTLKGEILSDGKSESDSYVLPTIEATTVTVDAVKEAPKVEEINIVAIIDDNASRAASNFSTETLDSIVGDIEGNDKLNPEQKISIFSAMLNCDEYQGNIAQLYLNFAREDGNLELIDKTIDFAKQYNLDSSAETDEFYNGITFYQSVFISALFNKEASQEQLEKYFDLLNDPSKEYLRIALNDTSPFTRVITELKEGDFINVALLDSFELKAPPLPATPPSPPSIRDEISELNKHKEIVDKLTEYFDQYGDIPLNEDDQAILREKLQTGANDISSLNLSEFITKITTPITAGGFMPPPPPPPKTISSKEASKVTVEGGGDLMAAIRKRGEQTSVTEASTDAPPPPPPKSPAAGTSDPNVEKLNTILKEHGGIELTDEQKEKYINMLKVGLPDGAVINKLAQAGLIGGTKSASTSDQDAARGETPPSKSPAAGASDPNVVKLNTILKEHGGIELTEQQKVKYINMLKVGLAEGAVINKLIADEFITPKKGGTKTSTPPIGNLMNAIKSGSHLKPTTTNRAPARGTPLSLAEQIAAATAKRRDSKISGEDIEAQLAENRVKAEEEKKKAPATGRSSMLGELTRALGKIRNKMNEDESDDSDDDNEINQELISKANAHIDKLRLYDSEVSAEDRDILASLRRESNEAFGNDYDESISNLDRLIRYHDIISSYQDVRDMDVTTKSVTDMISDVGLIKLALDSIEGDKPERVLKAMQNSIDSLHQLKEKINSNDSTSPTMFGGKNLLSSDKNDLIKSIDKCIENTQTDLIPKNFKK
jgi:hypothetical protein